MFYLCCTGSRLQVGIAQQLALSRVAFYSSSLHVPAFIDFARVVVRELPRQRLLPILLARAGHNRLSLLPSLTMMTTTPEMLYQVIRQIMDPRKSWQQIRQQDSLAGGLSQSHRL